VTVKLMFRRDIRDDNKKFARDGGNGFRFTKALAERMKQVPPIVWPANS
jgi:hypothetical protein